MLKSHAKTWLSPIGGFSRSDEIILRINYDRRFVLVELMILPPRTCTLLMVRTLRNGWIHKNSGSPDFQLCRSRDHGRSWSFSVGTVDWDCTEFGEISAIRLKDGRFLAAVRRQLPGTVGEGFEDTVMTESAGYGRCCLRYLGPHNGHALSQCPAKAVPVFQPQQTCPSFELIHLHSRKRTPVLFQQVVLE